MRGDFNMTLVFILGLEMGLITPENLGKLDLLGE